MFMSPSGFAMGLAPSSSLFRRLITRQPARLGEDPADMGTAFGLEASLGPVSAYPDRGDARVQGALPREDTPMGWLGRRPKRPR